MGWRSYSNHNREHQREEKFPRRTRTGRIE
jgi:hypothetical protein